MTIDKRGGMNFTTAAGIVQGNMNWIDSKVSKDQEANDNQLSFSEDKMWL